MSTDAGIIEKLKHGRAVSGIGPADCKLVLDLILELRAERDAAALQGSVVVSLVEYENTLAILKKLDAQICAAKDTLTAAKMASQVPRHDGKDGAA
jgi:hypothetical protein